ncbi:family 16 glycoside hydrolase [Verrucomicrobiota bacterium]
MDRPVKPEPYVGNALIDVNKWHSVKITALGPKVAVALDGRDVLQFSDNSFLSGHICLQGEEGGVRYRNLKVTPLEQ